MRVLLINPPSDANIGRDDKSVSMAGKKAYLPPLGLITVAALLPVHWRLKLIDGAFQTVTDADWDDCDLVIVSGTIVQLDSILETIREAKRRIKTVAVGGPGIYHFPQEALDAGADIVVRGEAEVTVPQFLTALEQRSFGIVIENLQFAEMTGSPVPRFDLLDLDAYVDLTVQFSRGCPFRCEFCDVTMLFGRAIRTKSPQQMLRELQTLFDLGWHRQVHFVDDNFIGTPIRSKVFLKELIYWMDAHRRPFEFYTYASVNLAGFPELIELMVRAGFTMVMLGIETTDKETLRSSRKFQNAAVDLEDACATINKAGLEVVALTMVGFDNEPAGSDTRLVEFAARTHIPEVCVSLVHALTGTMLWQRLKSEGRLLDGDNNRLYDWHGLALNFVPTRPVAQIMDEFVHVHEVLYEPDRYFERAFGHFATMKPHPVKVPYKLPDLFELRVLIVTLIKQGILSPARRHFWKWSSKALLGFSRQRFSLFIRACVKLERYLERRRALSGKLKELKAAANRKVPV